MANAVGESYHVPALRAKALNLITDKIIINGTSDMYRYLT
jgi:hypothetical protein